MALFTRFRVLPIVLLVALCGCTKKDAVPTAPTPTTTSQTKIIAVSGSLAFGDVEVGTSLTHNFIISNGGNTVMNITGMQAVGGTGITGLQANPTSAIIPAGGSIPATLQFSPTTAQFYSAVLTVIGDQTSGNPAINISGTGVNTTPLFTATGTGNTMFDLPNTVQKLHIVATYAGAGANFVAALGPSASACGMSLGDGCRWLANQLMGTDFNQTVYDAVVQTGGGGQVSITESAGVQWSFVEIR